MIQHQIHNSQGNYTYNAFVYRDRSYADHFHKNFELIYVKEGEAIITVDRAPVELKEGELLLLSPYRVHSFSVGGETCIWVGVFSGDFVQSFAAKYGGASFSKFRADRETEQFLLSHLFYQGVPEHYVTKACLYLVCDACLREATLLEPPATQGFRSRVVAHLSERLPEELTMRAAAAALGYEYHYFSKLFHDTFSLNFKEFVNILRFEQACRLLEEEGITVTEISTRCGFGSIRNFNRIFRTMSGQTPSEYRSMFART